MKFIAVVLAFAATALAQSITDLPPCSISCLTTGVSQAGCGVTDSACQCGSKRESIEATVEPCLAQSCSAADAAKVMEITGSICASVGGGSSDAGTAASGSGTATAGAAPSQTASGSGASRFGAAGALVAAAGLLAL